MQIELNNRDEAIINAKLKTGQFNSPSQVVRAALGLMSITPLSVEDMEAMIRQGLDDADAGRVVDGQEAIERLDAKHAALKSKPKRTA